MEKTCSKCGGVLEMSRFCSAWVCENCDHHEVNLCGQRLARCFCGWAASGGNGRRELEEMGEQIEADY